MVGVRTIAWGVPEPEPKAIAALIDRILGDGSGFKLRSYAPLPDDYQRACAVLPPRAVDGYPPAALFVIAPYCLQRLRMAMPGERAAWRSLYERCRKAMRPPRRGRRGPAPDLPSPAVRHLLRTTYELLARALWALPVEKGSRGAPPAAAIRATFARFCYDWTPPGKKLIQEVQTSLVGRTPATKFSLAPLEGLRLAMADWAGMSPSAFQKLVCDVSPRSFLKL